VRAQTSRSNRQVRATRRLGADQTSSAAVLASGSSGTATGGSTGSMSPDLAAFLASIQESTSAH
jgi:hypothetical protein